MIRPGLSWTVKMPYRSIMSAVLLLSIGSLLAGCGGGSGDGAVIPGGGGGSNTLAPSFNSAQDPAPDKVTMASVVVLGDELTVSVNVTETDGIASASLEITFDPAYVEFVEWSCGELFPPCGSSTLALFSESPGRLVIGLAKTFAGSGEDAFGTEVLLRLTFRALQAGASPLGFDSSRSALTDPDLNDIPGISWYGGTIIAN